MTEQVRIVAVIVTCRRAKSLARTLRGLSTQSRQPDEIVVVDNGGDNETAKVLDAFDAIPSRVIRPGCNTGPAGGFARGISAAVKDGADWCWIMDDDIEAETEALDRMLEVASLGGWEKTYWPTVIDPDGSANPCPGWWGVLVSSYVVSKHGVPREDYVWWSEDTEYLQYRLKQKGNIEDVRIKEAVVRHHHASRAGIPASWKLYYETRNSIHFRLYIKRANYWRLLRLAGHVLKRSVIYPRRIRRITYVIIGTIHGLTGRLGPRVDLE